MATLHSSSTPSGTPGHGVPHGSSAPLVVPPAITPPVEIRSSSRRTKSSSASWRDGRIVVLVPARLSQRERQEAADRLVERLLARARRSAGSDASLEARAMELADRYLDGVRPTSVRWVGNQNSRWASCTPSAGSIRLSHRLQAVPAYVLDAVLVHELAHLVDPSHSPRFRRLERRYPRLAESDAYLAGYALGLATAPAGGQQPVAGHEEVGVISC